MPNTLLQVPPLSGGAVNAAARCYAQARIVADLCVLADLTELPEDPGTEWMDTRPMTDLREVSADTAQMAALGLELAQTCRLIVRHADHPYLVRLTATGRLFRTR